jgi:2-polyprenyl-6-hydroxyphenyl methylase/3-demethylubiquinone-9 3-methyltransferase
MITVDLGGASAHLFCSNGTELVMIATAEQIVGTADAEEIARFEAMAEDWWNPDGKFAPLHKFNPVRLAYIRDRLCRRFDRDPMAERPLEGLRLLDIGCGGGLLTEPMHRMGASITGVDASERNIGIAAAHAAQSGLEVDYRAGTVEELVASGTEPYDAVLNCEVVEHVADVGLFLGACAQLVRPGGMMVLATLNRTPKSYALAIVGAEYVLRWLPRGTHQWKKFLRPSEIADCLRPEGIVIDEMTGVTYNPLSDRWRMSDDLAVNYMMVATRD